jgi:hypothetical protein
VPRNFAHGGRSGVCTVPLLPCAPQATCLLHAAILCSCFLCHVAALDTLCKLTSVRVTAGSLRHSSSGSVGTVSRLRTGRAGSHSPISHPQHHNILPNLGPRWTMEAVSADTKRPAVELPAQINTACSFTCAAKSLFITRCRNDVKSLTLLLDFRLPPRRK